MKEKLRILTLALVSALTFSCSSDDNSTPDGGTQEGKTKELKVIDNFIYTSFDKGKAIETITITYNYNEDGTVKNREEISKFHKEPGEVEREVLTYTYKDKLPYAITLESYLVNNNHETWNLQYIYENNRIVKGDGISSDNEKTLYSFTYNSKGLLTSTKTNNDKTPNGTTYKYDDKNNLIEVDSNGLIELITYDDKKSPYTNMNISDQAYSMEFFEDHEQFLIRSPHNVTGTIFDYEPSTQEYHAKYVHTNKYDKEGYLESASVENVGEKTKASELKYTYKTITVPVKQ